MRKDLANIEKVIILEGAELEAKGMNLFWNVGKGANVPPRMIAVYYKGNKNSDEVDIALVGKGVTYDTGGLNIKVSSMEMMYGDKGGACAVLAALEACAEMGLEKNVVFAMAFADNAVSNEAYRPGDILTAMNGLTVEIENTDAEGRLVMSDTMTFVQREWKPKKCLYIATLTGSIAIALGIETAGLYAPNDDMAKSVLDASEEAFENLWRMPITDEHRRNMKGKWGSDLGNIGAGGRFGGSSKAAAFLERFIEEDRPWCHLDIAGPANFNEANDAGFGAKTLLYLIKNL